MVPTKAVPRGKLIFRMLCVTGTLVVPMFGASVAAPDLERGFARDVRPFINEYCAGCHSGAKPAAQLDLKTVATLSAVMQDLPHWTLLMERLERQEMPPKPLAQPPADRRQKVIEWVKAVRAGELRRTAGDPGPVLARRLSNSEYDYSIRDLTGVDLRPTREFPVDPANLAGFDNTGETLNMSPALFNKYLAAAREVSDHMALTPDGFVFAPGPMLVETDRDQFAIRRIVDFYEAQPTDYADYFEAAWRYKYRAALGKPAATLVATATARKVSPKYLPVVWGILGEQQPKAEVGPVGKLQAMWKTLPAPTSATPTDKQLAAVRAKCVEMRDFVVKIRNHTAMQFTAPVVTGPPPPPAPVQAAADPAAVPGAVPGGRGGRGGRGGGFRRGGLPEASQPLLTWKYTQFNTHRRDFDHPRPRLRPVHRPPDEGLKK